MNAARTASSPRPAPDYVRYERLKRELLETRGAILPLMYDVEIRRIAKECGI